ncbi:MAG: hypothetical protein WKG32_04130 [Gemmatimonadaceae bacterium]
MFSTCIFCQSALGANDVIEPFPVGRRLAFDGARGRLWVVCRKCGRWNLSPLDERWEAIEECERRFRDTRVRVSTDNIGLAKLPEGLELVRVGKPLRPEFAAWRYGGRFGRRRRNALLMGGAGAAAAVVAAPVAVAGVPILLLGYVVPSLTVPYSELRDYIQAKRVVARVRVEQGAGHRTLTVRVRQLRDSAFIADAPGDDPELDLAHDGGRTRLTGSAATRVVAALLARSNMLGGSRAEVREAVRRIDAVGDPSHFFVRASRLARRAGGRVMPSLQRIGALNLTAVERLALEMALHEETERRAMEGELALLEEAWREAEEVAAIADNLFLPATITLRALEG